MKRWVISFGLLVLGGLPRHAVGEGRVLSVVGPVHADGKKVSAPGALLPGDLQVGAPGAAQVLLEDRMAVSVAGDVRLRLPRRVSEGVRIVRLAAGSTVMVSGAGVTVLAVGARLVLGGEGATLRLGPERFQVIEGQVTLHSPSQGEPRKERAGAGASLATEGAVASSASQPTELVGTTTLRAGQAVALDPVGRMWLVPTRVEVREAAFQPPAPWNPAVDEVSVAEVHRVREVLLREREGERQTASCGCTEGRGPAGAPVTGRGPGVSPLEGMNGVLRVRVSGVPRMTP